MLKELFVEEEQVDPHMIVPVFKTADGRLVIDEKGFPIIEKYEAVRPRFIQRRDYFTDDWCIINATRANRPKVFTSRSEATGIDFLHPDMYRYNPKDMTQYNGMSPEDVVMMIMNDPELNKKGDICRIVGDGNIKLREVLALYPFLLYHSIKTDFVCKKDGTWDPEALIRSLEQTAKRTRHLCELGYKPINIRNYGPDSGASQALEHDQTGGLKIRTNRIKREVSHSIQFYEQWNMPLHDAVQQAEKKTSSRVIKETPYTFLLCPFAPVVATRESRILLKPDYKTLDQVLDDKECFRDFTTAFVSLINAYIKSGVGSFNYAILQDSSPFYRLNVLIAASQSYGGMERVHDTVVIEELPEVSTQVLRQYLT